MLFTAYLLLLFRGLLFLQSSVLILLEVIILICFGGVKLIYLVQVPHLDLTPKACRD